MTSLGQQLKSLAVPQTSGLADLKKRASILFDPKEAATKDRKVIYDLGYQGLVELIALNHEFAQFADTLFQLSSLHLERSVEDSTFNQELDKNIKKFIFYLSPYFMLRSAHMCLEWLIRRFQVHEYNKDALMCLILPYHETNIFVKCVQVLKIKTQSDEWRWLHPIQKPGVTLAKSVIINRAETDPNFLLFICKNVVCAVKELGARASTLQALINFYCSVVIGALDNCGEVKEWHISTVLPSILKGMKSGVVDFISASFMITAELVGKVKLTEKLRNSLVSQIWKVKSEHLQSSLVLLLSWIAKNQMEANICFPHNGFTQFISNKWLTSTISGLFRQGISMHYIVIPLIHTSLELIKHNTTDKNVCMVFLEELLSEVELPNHSAEIVIRLVLDTFVPEEAKVNFVDGEIIDLESDTETSANNNIQNWFLGILNILERQYPVEVDKVIKETMLNDNGNTSNNAIRVALSLRYKFLDADTSSIFQNIYNANPKIRAISVNELIKHVKQSNNDTRYYSLLQEILAERIKDDNEIVVEEILKLSTEVLVKILGHKYFVESVIEILYKAKNRLKTWSCSETLALTHLTSDIVVKTYDLNLILLSVIGYLLPIHNDEESSKYIKLILQSPFAESMKFLHTAALKLKYKAINPIEFKKEFLNMISQSDDTPRADALVQSVLDNGQNYFRTAVDVSHFLILITACLKAENEPETTHKILNFTIRQCNPFHIAYFKNNQLTSETEWNAVPLQLFLDLLEGLVGSTSFNNLKNWKSPSKSLKLGFGLLNLLTSNAFSMQLGNDEKREWAKCLKSILNVIFRTPIQKLDVLSNFLIYENVDGIKSFTELRIRAIKLLGAILMEERNAHLETRFIFKAIVALNSPISTIRECSLNILHIVNSLPLAKDLQKLTEKILGRKEEILFDAEQIPLILYTILNTKNKNPKSDSGLLCQLLKIIDDPATDMAFKSKLFELLKHIKSSSILNAMIPNALNALNNIHKDGSILVLEKNAANIFKSVIIRFEENCMHKVFTANKEAWQLIENSLKMPKIFINHLDGKLVPVPCITLQIFDEVNYEKLPAAHKIKFLMLVIETVSLSDNDELFLYINRAVRRCYIDCKHILPLLQCMINGSNDGSLQKKGTTAKYNTSDINLINSLQWKHGVIFLEVLENKKRLQNSYVLVPILFDILKKCLDMENQPSLEYTKQLVLSALLQSCQMSNRENLLKDLPENTFRIDLIVQCIRVTQNPQTHYNALVLLSHCAGLFPQQVLHNLVNIFTFMGSSIARHDDAFSFQVISNIVQSVIPILVRENNPSTSLSVPDPVVPVLKIFSDILLDVPEHRRTPLYSKLLHTLGAKQYFWVFLCIVFESQVINDEKEKLSVRKGSQIISRTPSQSTENLPKRIKIILNLLHEFGTDISLQCCVSLLSYVKGLPMNKDETKDSPSDEALGSPDFKLFDVKARSAKQLRHYKYLILQFVSTFTSSVEFLKATASQDKLNYKLTNSIYQQFIIKTLSFIPDVNSAVEKSVDTSQSKFWKVLLHHCYDALDNIISLLSPDMFLVVVNGLMQHKLITIRKKSIELLISKLQQKNDYFSKCNEENTLNVLRSLSETISTILTKDQPLNSISPATMLFITNETIIVQQSALIAIKLLSRRLAMQYIEDFRSIIDLLISVIKKRAALSKVIFATVILTLVEVTSNLKANSISHLPKFMPHLIDALKDQAAILQNQPSDNVCVSLITGIQRLFEAMPLFLGPYIIGIITTLSTIWSRIQSNCAEQEQRKAINFNKLQAIWSKIAIDVPARVLIPHCEKAYKMLLEDQSYSSINFLMKLLLECISKSNSDLAAVQKELTNLFLEALEFRSQMDPDARLGNVEETCQTETEIINAFVAWILKLSESSFRPIYKKVYNWALYGNGSKARVLTFFIFNKCISSSLKSLFVLFAADIVKDAATLLDACNTCKNDFLYFTHCEALNTELLKNILSTLTSLFTHDNKSFANPHRFDLLMQPIVDQLENNLIQNNDELQYILLSCIGQLAVAVSSDVLWKQLNYQILLKTRTNVPHIRIIAFNCCVELARKLGDDFISLLPETIPFVAELFEDESPQVVNNSRKAMRELETILGESLQKYF